MKQIILVAHNLRSAHNVGSLLRTAEGLGVKAVCLTGHTPYPILENDARLPHLAKKIDAKIAKTALGAEKMTNIRYDEDISILIGRLKTDGYTLAALEQSKQSVRLPDYVAPEKVALLVGREVEGVEAEVLETCDEILEIPMFGGKESFNVAVAAGMALYALRFAP